MPNQARSGIHGTPWHSCARCGFDYQIKDLAWQDGLLVCIRTCFDKQTVKGRILQLARVNEMIGLHPDMELDPKLTNPTMNSSEED